MRKTSTVVFTILCMLLFVGCSTFNKSDVISSPGMDTKNPCLIYIARATNAEGISKDCVGGEMGQIMQGEGIQEIAVANDSKQIAFISSIPDQRNQVWLMASNGNDRRKIFSCDDASCDRLSISPNGELIFLSLSGAKSAFIQYDIALREETIISNYGADFVDLSPNGKILRFLEKETGLMRVLSIPDLKIVFSFATDIDLIGGWSPDSEKFLFGEREAAGNLMAVSYREVEIASKQSTTLFTLPTGTDYYQPIYSEHNTLYALVRTGLRTNTRQVQEIDRQGKPKQVISDSAGYDHFSLEISHNGEFLVFQRYDLTSSQSTPEIVLWDVQEDSLLLAAENALRPRWMN